ncbi:FkbM family methyltransferase [Salinimicrobium soli]|uniref:FkbM family methyltransferase n=1 Tax=Salinimicrobium soli TaxID=1254399 RepID=UPI003AAD6F1C
MKKKILASLGLFGSKANKSNVYNLIKSLRPVVTTHRLVRVGGDGDGGYLVPNDLSGIKACFSPGVGPVIEFEKECAEKGMKVFMADASVKKPEYNNKNIYFIDKYIGDQNKKDFVKFEDWIYTQGFKDDDEFILQMDVEGHEYEIFKSVDSKLLQKFRIIVVEFHHLDKLKEDQFFKNALAAFNKILKNHTCVHIHPNNCRGEYDVFGMKVPRLLEFTFYRNDKLEQNKRLATLPHPLDKDNTNNKTIELSEIWYKDI